MPGSVRVCEDEKLLLSPRLRLARLIILVVFSPRCYLRSTNHSSLAYLAQHKTQSERKRMKISEISSYRTSKISLRLFSLYIHSFIQNKNYKVKFFFILSVASPQFCRYVLKCSCVIKIKIYTGEGEENSLNFRASYLFLDISSSNNKNNQRDRRGWKWEGSKKGKKVRLMVEKLSTLFGNIPTVERRKDERRTTTAIPLMHFSRNFQDINDSMMSWRPSEEWQWNENNWFNLLYYCGWTWEMLEWNSSRTSFTWYVQRLKDVNGFMFTRSIKLQIVFRSARCSKKKKEKCHKEK